MNLYPLVIHAVHEIGSVAVCPSSNLKNKTQYNQVYHDDFENNVQCTGVSYDIFITVT